MKAEKWIGGSESGHGKKTAAVLPYLVYKTKRGREESSSFHVGSTLLLCSRPCTAFVKKE